MIQSYLYHNLEQHTHNFAIDNKIIIHPKSKSYENNYFNVEPCHQQL